MPATKLDRYELIEEIGRGGMATVYRAYDPSFEREVALKVLPQALLHDPQFRDRFQREIKTVAKLEHPAIVPVYDVGEDAGLPYFVMRYMTGGSLADRLALGPYSLHEATRIVNRISEALEYAHKKGVIHRDLKPDNILFDENGDSFISDFGVAKLEASASTLTGSMMVGTPAYMSPEQAQTGEIDSRSDIYGMGVILYHLLSGEQPYEATTPMGIIFKHVNDPVPDIHTANPDIPEMVSAVIKTAMAKERENRYKTASDMAHALNQAVYGVDKTQPSAYVKPVETSTTIFPRIRPWLIVGVVVLLTAIAGTFLLGRKAATPVSPTATEQAVEASLEISTPQAQPSPTAGLISEPADRIAFVSGKEIWLMNPDGTELSPLTNSGSGKSHLQWLPDGESILYISGTCVFSVNIETAQFDTIVCFRRAKFLEGFRVSPDGNLVAISLNRELFIVPFDRQRLKKVENKPDLLAMDDSCLYNLAASKDIRWSKDGSQLAITLLDTSRLIDKIRILDISPCPIASPILLAEFPPEDALPEGYKVKPDIPGFDWDGDQLILFNDVMQNEGFGNLYLYDNASQQISLLNPIEGSCCYRDARWSPDGEYVLFLFQNEQAAQISNQFFYVTFSELLSGQIGSPFEFPFPLLTGETERPQPALRPAP